MICNSFDDSSHKNKEKFFLKKGREGVSKGQLSLFIFFVPDILEIIFKHKSFFKYKGRGPPGALEGTSSPPP